MVTMTFAASENDHCPKTRKHTRCGPTSGEAPPNPAESGPNLSNIGRRLAKFGQHLVDIAQIRPQSARHWRTSDNFGRNRAHHLVETGLNSVELARTWSNPGHIWPNLGQTWPNPGHVFPKWSQLRSTSPKLRRIWATVGRAGAKTGGHCKPSVEIGPCLARIRAKVVGWTEVTTMLHPREGQHTQNDLT